MNNPLFDETELLGKPYVKGDWQKIAIHSNTEIKGFFGEYVWLSNFHLCQIYHHGLSFPTSEHAYMFAKLDLSKYTQKEIEEFYQQVTKMSSREVKKWGQTIPLKPDWEEVKYETMAAIIFDKFYRNKDLRAKLLATDDKYLEETNWWSDQFWGVDYQKGGQNNLGKILMKTRTFWKK